MSETTKNRKSKHLTIYAKSRIACIMACAFHHKHGYPHGMTTAEIARVTGQSTNNCAKRVQEAAGEGYLERHKVDGEPQRRKSLDSNKSLDIWVRIDKEIPTPQEQKRGQA